LRRERKKQDLTPDEIPVRRMTASLSWSGFGDDA
jgi:hypothetical protein